MDVYIQAVSYYLPAAEISNESLAIQFPEWGTEKIAAKIGVTSRHISAQDETAGDMAVIAAEKLFSDYAIDKSSIDFVILCTQSPDYPLPPTSCIIQDKLGLSTTCGAVDINLGCSGYIYGLSVAKGLIVGRIASKVLLITSETYSKYILPDDKGCRTIFGDGAAATIISTEGYARIDEFVLGTDGSGADKLIVKTGGARQKDKAGNRDDFLYMDGASVFDFSARRVPDMVKDVIRKNGVSSNDIGLYIFHQANKYMINYLRKIIGIPQDRFFVFLDKVGNTVSSSIPIALEEARRGGALKGKVLLAGFGVGFSYGAVVITIDKRA